MSCITSTNIKELKKLYSGKVRDIYEVNDNEWLIVTTDRISAFDVVFNEGIPDKGLVLNKISNVWFSKFNFVKNHLISTEPEKVLSFLKNYPGIPERSVIVKKVKRLPVECVVRGYLFGSVLDEYNKYKTAGGVKLPDGLRMAEILPQSIFTPATKAEVGHDENINKEKFLEIVGKEVGLKIIDYSIKIYENARDLLKKHNIILADTKFEFGVDENNELILIDEVLTPDSSRYWDGNDYQVGTSPKSYDKQFVRDYLISINWNKTPPPPKLPEDIINKTRDKYLQILKIIESI